MRYIWLLISLINSNAFCLEKSSSRRQLQVKYHHEPKLLDEERNSRQIMLSDMGTALIAALKACAKPSEIQEHLDRWDTLKTLEINVETDQINEIIVTARTIQELALKDAQSPTVHVGLKSSMKLSNTTYYTSESSRAVDNYINAQLNYDKICNHLGIKNIFFVRN